MTKIANTRNVECLKKALESALDQVVVREVQQIVRDAAVVGAVIGAGGDCLVNGAQARTLLGNLSRTQLHRLVKKGILSGPINGRYRLSEIQRYIASTEAATEAVP